MLLPIPLLAIAFVIASLLMATQLVLDRRPAVCPACPHCRARLMAEEQEQRELQEDYARRVGLGSKDDHTPQIR